MNLYGTALLGDLLGTGKEVKMGERALCVHTDMNAKGLNAVDIEIMEEDVMTTKEEKMKNDRGEGRGI